MNDEPQLQKHTLNLRAGDMDFLKKVYRPQGVNPSVIIRRLVSKAVDQLAEKHPTLTKDIDL